MSLQAHLRRCITLQHTATHCSTLQHTVTHCNTLPRTATHCNTLQRTATHCNILQYTATHCNTLQHTATHCNTVTHLRVAMRLSACLRHCNTLQHTATRCNTVTHLRAAMRLSARLLGFMYASAICEYACMCVGVTPPPPCVCGECGERGECGAGTRGLPCSGVCECMCGVCVCVCAWVCVCERECVSRGVRVDGLAETEVRGLGGARSSRSSWGLVARKEGGGLVDRVCCILHIYECVYMCSS